MKIKTNDTTKFKYYSVQSSNYNQQVCFHYQLMPNKCSMYIIRQQQKIYYRIIQLYRSHDSYYLADVSKQNLFLSTDNETREFRLPAQFFKYSLAAIISRVVALVSTSVSVVCVSLRLLLLLLRPNLLSAVQTDQLNRRCHNI